MKSGKFLFAFAIVGLLFIGTNFGDFDVPVRAGLASSTYTTTYSNGDTDTLDFSREAVLSGLSFSAHFADSVDIDSITVRRIINGTVSKILGSDNLSTADSLTAAGSRVYTVTLAPLAEIYRVLVYYGNDAGGVQAGNTPTVRYGFNKQYSR